MHVPLPPHLASNISTGSNTVLAVAHGAFSYLSWILLCGLLGLVAVIRVVRQPAQSFKHLNWSKVAWIAAILYLAPVLGGYPIPIGGIAAIWRTRRRPTPADPPVQLPRAQGSPNWPFPWGAK